MKRITKPPPVEVERFYTPSEVGATFHVTNKTVARWRERGDIPADQIVRTPGGRYLFRAAWIDALLNGHGDAPQVASDASAEYRHIALAAHDGYAEHSHEVRPDHLGVKAASPGHGDTP